ncbi:hypothetical protein [Selenomonas ruminantium]|uniref:HNH endonuclease n=1 Tax=Selenomonas ruminantium TaxID=971 RepID=A0A1H3WDG9_SELRU|nr:hypothetical protein [Selenomonas ruminantium]SDZ84382.1 hypothetical protein SAMN05660648_00860 [Selenomonas ruminantium]
MDRNETIRIKKILSEMQKDIFAKTTPKVCVICKKEISSTCISHSIPKFILKNISSNGNLYTSNNFIDIPFIEKTKGIKKAGIFRRICRDCDNTIFKAYETPENYQKGIDNIMLYQIAIKILLNNIYTRETSVRLILDGIKTFTSNVIDRNLALRNVQSHINAEIMTIAEENKRLNMLLNSSPNATRYNIIFNEKLPYVVPYAIQDEIVLVSDMRGRAINNIFSTDIKTSMQSIKICIFPLEAETFIIVFRDKKSTKYNSFERQFSKLSLNDKLGIINYIVFLYSEKQFLSNKINDKIFESNIRKYSKTIQQKVCYNDEDPYSKEFRLEYKLDNFRQCENLLLEQYALS